MTGNTKTTKHTLSLSLTPFVDVQALENHEQEHSAFNTISSESIVYFPPLKEFVDVFIFVLIVVSLIFSSHRFFCCWFYCIFSHFLAFFINSFSWRTKTQKTFFTRECRLSSNLYLHEIISHTERVKLILNGIATMTYRLYLESLKRASMR